VSARCASDAPVMQRWRYDEPSMNRPPSIKRLFPCHDLYSGWLMVAGARSRFYCPSLYTPAGSTGGENVKWV
jgi:hypothetical protein